MEKRSNIKTGERWVGVTVQRSKNDEFNFDNWKYKNHGLWLRYISTSMLFVWIVNSPKISCSLHLCVYCVFCFMCICGCVCVCAHAMEAFLLNLFLPCYSLFFLLLFPLLLLLLFTSLWDECCGSDEWRQGMTMMMLGILLLNIYLVAWFCCWPISSRTNFTIWNCSLTVFVFRFFEAGMTKSFRIRVHIIL